MATTKPKATAVVLGTLLPLAVHPVSITRPDGETVTVLEGPYVVAMPGVYRIAGGDLEPVEFTVE
ncbi:hypothetical protein [Nocardioides sp.]|uniref:hypothetical protein n=1 Tax=Nocardioides sp. TaxID=35761 RepID=UPI002B6928F7|nr:hypothetical protein [Nocardioides sp.]HSX66672.1 hypothetical protein [Nocardioides sp.]